MHNNDCSYVACSSNENFNFRVEFLVILFLSVSLKKNCCKVDASVQMIKINIMHT